jgi:HK97 family phage portal protein
MAFWSAVNLMEKVISKCEFKTYEKGEEVKKREYYLWNIEPNRNQNSSGFLRKLIATLYRCNEVLVVEHNGELLIADSFERKPYAMYEDVFKDVTVGDFTYSRTFVQSEVLYWQLNSVDMRRVINGIYESYSKLLSYTMKAYQRSRGTKGVFNYDALPVSGTEQRAAFDALTNEKISKWLNSDSSALPLGRGQSWTELKDKTYSSESTRDIRAMIDDIYDFTAKGFGIPPVLLRGDVAGTKDAVEVLLTFSADPLTDMLSEEINRKRYGYTSFTAGTYLSIDTKTIKHVDLLSVSTAIDKLIASGAFCINDIRISVGERPIDEPWAWQHWMTKNYAPAQDVMNGLGGEGNE